jgi:hypothetical protein
MDVFLPTNKGPSSPSVGFQDKICLTDQSVL